MSSEIVDKSSKEVQQPLQPSNELNAAVIQGELGASSTVPNSVFDEGPSHQSAPHKNASENDPLAQSQHLQQPLGEADFVITQAPQNQTDQPVDPSQQQQHYLGGSQPNFGNIMGLPQPVPMDERVAKTQSRGGQRSQNLGFSSTQRPTNRPSQHNQQLGVRGNSKQQGTTNQFMYKSRKQEPVMGIGPGGSDLSQFFASQMQQQRGSNAPTRSGNDNFYRSKPQTAGSLSHTLAMDQPTDFGSNSKDSSSKQISALAPNITNIGFQPVYTTGQQPPVGGPLLGSGPYIMQKPQTSHQTGRTGSLVMQVNQNDRAKSNSRGQGLGKKGGIGTLAEQNSNAQSNNGPWRPRYGNSSVGAFSTMKPCVQGSSLHKPGTKSGVAGASKRNTQSQFQQKQQQAQSQIHGAGVDKTHVAQFADYNFFSQKLSKKSIPKNQEIKFRKEMQQLKFYQTLNSYPYIVLQQLQQQQRRGQSQAAARAPNNNMIKQTNIPTGVSTRNGGPALAAAPSPYPPIELVSPGEQAIGYYQDGQQSPSQEMLEAHGEGIDGRSGAGVDRSTKLTVYQMHSSRGELKGRDKGKGKGAQVPANQGSMSKDQLQQIAKAAKAGAVKTGEATRTSYDQVEESQAQHSLLRNEDQTSTGPFLHNGGSTTEHVNVSEILRDENLFRVSQDGKASIIAQETDLLISTKNVAYNMENSQPQMYDASPKMHAKEQMSQSKMAKSHGSSEVTNPVMHGASKVAMDGNKVVQTRKNSLATNLTENKKQKANGARAIGSAKGYLNNTLKISNDDLVQKATDVGFEMMQQTASADYFNTANQLQSQLPNTEAISRQFSITRKVSSKQGTGTNSQSPIQQRQQHIMAESRSSNMMVVQGSQLKRDEKVATAKTGDASKLKTGQVSAAGAKKEIARVQSLKPIAEPLIESAVQDHKSSYFRDNSNLHVQGKENNDDGATVLLEKQRINADISVNEGYQGAVNARNDNQTLQSQTILSEEERRRSFKGTGNTSSQNRPRLSSGKNGSGAAFEEHVSGIGVGSLFSVWGPNSKQQRARVRSRGAKESRANIVGGDMQNVYGSAASGEYGTSQGRQSSEQHVGQRGRSSQGLGIGTQMSPDAQQNQEPGKIAHHMQLVNSIINDGSLHNLVFSNGTLNSEYLQSSKGQVTKMIAGHHGDTNVYDAQAAAMMQDGMGNIDGDIDDADDEDDEELIIVTMLRSMNSKKLETCQLKEMKLEIDIDKVRNEIRLEYFKEIQQKHDLKVEAEWRCRLEKFDRIFNKIIAKQLMMAEENALMRKLEDQVRSREEKLKNPFYLTLKAQKEERDKFIDFYTNGVLFGLPAITVSGKADNDSSMAVESQQQQLDQMMNETEISPRDNQDKDQGLGDLFKQTAIDIEDEPTKGKGSSEQQQQDVFCFYQLQVEIPATFFAKLGDSRVVTADAILMVKQFIHNRWPVLAKRKRVTYRVSYNAATQVMNAVPLGKEAPVSKCCMRNVIFVFSREAEVEGGKVLCSDNFCTQATIDTFDMTPQLMHQLFFRGLKHIDMPMADANAAGFMDGRQRMQGRPQQRLGKRYSTAVSNELSRKVKAGNYKHMTLKNVIADPKLQSDRMLCSQRYQATGGAGDTSDLVDMIMDLPRASEHPYDSRFASVNSSSRINENQMLADLIQQQAINRHRHKAQLPISKLMNRVSKMQNQQRGGAVSTTGDMIASSEDAHSGADHLHMQMLDSMFQASNQQQYHQQQQHAIYVKRVDNAPTPVNYSNADIPDADSPGDDEDITELHSEQRTAMYSAHKEQVELDFRRVHVAALEQSVQIQNSRMTDADDTQERASIAHNSPHDRYRNSLMQQQQIQGTDSQPMMTMHGPDDPQYEYQANSKAPINVQIASNEKCIPVPHILPTNGCTVETQ